jgi:hypothetical protein
MSATFEERRRLVTPTGAHRSVPRSDLSGASSELSGPARHRTEGQPLQIHLQVGGAETPQTRVPKRLEQKRLGIDQELQAPQSRQTDLPKEREHVKSGLTRMLELGDGVMSAAMRGQLADIEHSIESLPGEILNKQEALRGVEEEIREFGIVMSLYRPQGRSDSGSTRSQDVGTPLTVDFHEKTIDLLLVGDELSPEDHAAYVGELKAWMASVKPGPHSSLLAGLAMARDDHRKAPVGEHIRSLSTLNRLSKAGFIDAEKLGASVAMANQHLCSQLGSGESSPEADHPFGFGFGFDDGSAEGHLEL